MDSISKRKVVVITPIKNEEWILETFLKITSQYADHILIADQNSTDKSLEIAAMFPKVDVIINDSVDFNEAHRQKLLINVARERYGKGNILLAIDADELLNFDALDSDEWSKIHSAESGTVLYFEKPTYFNGTEKVIRYNEFGGWPLGFIDDGSEHNPSYIHSTRIPVKENSPKLFLKDIKFLHCNLLSLKRQRSKIRYYCLLEASAKTNAFYHRLIFYNKDYDYSKEGNGVFPASPKWIDGWMKQGISLVPEKEESFYWYDLESLKLLESNMSRYAFWWEDIWDINWYEVSNHFNYKIGQISHPTKNFLIFRKGIYNMVNFLFTLKNRK
jgi:hypothetical protein